ncbi:hypothetical protein AB0F72_30510 [Actinoplanes sp. NPDC023936]|uniref:hypothetical protein n=1 Tax=Actinoplanes sp. NPDC023936 TaxID=3154910 RepID=UPI0033C1057C
MRLIVGGLVILALSMAGCAQTPGDVEQPEATVSVSLPADPKAALAVGAGKLGTQSARIVFTLGDQPSETRLTGVVDAATGNYEVTAEGFVVRRVGDDVWVKVLRMPTREDLFFRQEDLNKWIKQTAFNIETTTTFQAGFPWKLPRGTVTQGTKVTRAGEHSFRGTTIRQESPDGHFAAEMDAAGRLTRVSSGFGQSVDNLFVIEFSDYGLPVNIEAPPASEVIESPTFSTVGAGIL